MEKGLEHLFINSSRSHFFNKIDIEQYLFKAFKLHWLKITLTRVIENSEDGKTFCICFSYKSGGIKYSKVDVKLRRLGTEQL